MLLLELIHAWSRVSIQGSGCSIREGLLMEVMFLIPVLKCHRKHNFRHPDLGHYSSRTHGVGNVPQRSSKSSSHTTCLELKLAWAALGVRTRAGDVHSGCVILAFQGYFCFRVHRLLRGQVSSCSPRGSFFFLGRS